MSTSAELLKSRELRELQARPLDESVWQAWVLKGRAQDERIRIGWRKGITGISLLGLLFVVAAGAWPVLMPYDIVAKCIVVVGATVLMFQTLSANLARRKAGAK